MAHVRKQIRDNVVTAVTGLTTTGSRVYRSRVYPVDTVNLPGLLIYTTAEASEIDSLASPRGLERSLDLAVEGVAQATANLDNTLDQIAAEVETALAADTTRGGLAKDTYLASTEIQLSDEGDKPVGAVRMIFRVVYRTRETAPETAI